MLIEQEDKLKKYGKKLKKKTLYGHTDRLS